MILRKTLLMLFIVFGFSQLMAQSEYIDIVKKYYPLIYTSIKNKAEKQWGNDPKILEATMEGQAKAFIDIAESQSKIDPVAMTNSLLYGSITNEEEYNRTILDDLRIENPYPLLRCNWYKVKEQYDKTKGTEPMPNNRTDNSQIPEKADFRNDDLYTSENVNQIKIKNKEDNPRYRREFHRVGVSVDFVLSKLTGLENFAQNANPGKGFEFRVWGRRAISKTFFGMAELSFNYIYHSIEDINNENGGNLNHNYLKTTLMYGIYHDLSRSATLIIGAGGFVGVRGQTPDYERSKADYPTSDDIGWINYGFSGLAGIQWKGCEFALRGDWGLADMSRDGYGLRNRTISLSIGYLF